MHANFRDLVFVRRIKESTTCSVDLVALRGDPTALYVRKTITLEPTDGHAIGMAINEVAIMRAVRHTHVVELHDSWTIDNGSTVVIVMSYAPGGSLRDAIVTARAKRKYIPESRILRWLTQLASALAHLHTRGVLHRDIKPANVFLDANDNAILGDFGLSCVISRCGGRASASLGTPHYASPEILSSEASYTSRTDVWSLGVTLYTLCQLIRPFRGRTLKALTRAIKRSTPNALPPCYSHSLCGLVELLLEKRAAQRVSMQTVLHMEQLVRWHSAISAAPHSDSSDEASVGDAALNSLSDLYISSSLGGAEGDTDVPSDVIPPTVLWAHGHWKGLLPLTVPATRAKIGTWRRKNPAWHVDLPSTHTPPPVRRCAVVGAL